VRGSVLGFDADTSTGAVNGPGGKRYDFAITDWRDAGQPRHGDIVDFHPEGQSAVDIHLIEREYVRPTVAGLYFSAAGRMSRSQFWLKVTLPIIAIAFFLLIAIGQFAISQSLVLAGIFVISFVIFIFIAIWPLVAGMIKRAHDRDRPWPFILLLLVPLIQLWPLVEILFLRGTSGSNRFGADPISAS
jgi:uncharacterized membrane protein YhaH (DUF805 family)